MRTDRRTGGRTRIRLSDRGYEDVISALPEGSGLLALGRAADGHQDLPADLSRLAHERGRIWQLTGFLGEAELAARLRTVAVPVAPNRRTAASASIATWLAHGRRPLVPDTAYTRELARAWPETLTTYDGDDPTALRGAISQALRHPESTVLDAQVRVGPDLADVVADYRSHFAACAAPSPVVLAPGRVALPDNRWDLLDGRTPARVPTVSVVIPYYEAQQQLDLVLAALKLQTHPAGKLEVVVADDGSRRPPDIGRAQGLEIRVVRQDDRGFRAAAARNLGAAAADGEVLLFLDGDTVPEPTYVERMARLPALTPDALVVGRRRHADLEGWTPAMVSAWLTGRSSPPAELCEPEWLRDGYRNSRNLLRADGRSYRYVISAVLGLHHELFAATGGFNEAFVGYGGEDWELAHRVYVAGGVFAHVRDAVAWHDGPGWAERTGDHVAAKAAEVARLLEFVPDRSGPAAGPGNAYPAVVVRMPAEDPSGVRTAIRSAFAAGVDCGVWLTGPAARELTANLNDCRVHCGEVAPDVLARAGLVIELDAPIDLSALPDVLPLAGGVGDVRTEYGKLRSSRALSRARRHAHAFSGGADAALPVLFGRRDVSLAQPLGSDRTPAPVGLVALGAW
jgi:GT2 family glycosyltransferase